jgi:hypothetical protein
MRVKDFSSTEELQAYLQAMKAFSTSTPPRDPEPLERMASDQPFEKDREDERARLLL